MVRVKNVTDQGGKNKNSNKKKIPVFFKVAAISLISLGIFYITQVNRLSTMGYEIQKKENEIKKLQKENETLQAMSSHLRSMNRLEMEQEKLDMVKPVQVSYVDMGSTIAMK
ncbi:MAG TPA: hypothetical protein GX706_02515 [Candidatus Moranbacteria bacterium]|nr:hypothetical protein [Candidatus Moranbacteria bacterium]